MASFILNSAKDIAFQGLIVRPITPFTTSDSTKVSKVVAQVAIAILTVISLGFYHDALKQYVNGVIAQDLSKRTLYEENCKTYFLPKIFRAREKTNADGFSDLITCATKGDIEALKLLAKTEDLNFPGRNGTALQAAIIAGNVVSIKILDDAATVRKIDIWAIGNNEDSVGLTKDPFFLAAGGDDTKGPRIDVLEYLLNEKHFSPPSTTSRNSPVKILQEWIKANPTHTDIVAAKAVLEQIEALQAK